MLSSERLDIPKHNTEPAESVEELGEILKKRAIIFSVKNVGKIA
jgi:hypothetical protein